MRARVLFFGMLKELVGRSAEDIDLPDGADLGSVFELYAARQPRLREMAPSIVAAAASPRPDVTTHRGVARAD